MLTLSDLNKAAQIKKAANEAMAKVTGAVVTAGHKVSDVATAAKEAVAGAFPASNNTINERTVDILTVVAGLEQRVDYVEEVVGVTAEIDYDKAAVRAQGMFAQMKARREAAEQAEKQQAKQEKADAKAAKQEAKQQQATPAPQAPAQPQGQTRLSANAPVAGNKPSVHPNIAKMRVGLRFDAIPKMDQQ